MNNSLLFLVFFIVLIAVGLSCAWSKKFNTPSTTEGMELRVSTTRDVATHTGELEMIQSPDGADSLEMVGDYGDDVEEGFGLGPGPYGIGRHPSDMMG